MRNKTNAKSIATVDRQRQALTLRRGGASLQAIADQLGYAGPSGAKRAIESALQQTLAHDASALRHLEGERLDRLQLAIWPAAMKGDTRAVDGVLRIMSRRAALFGLDAPTQSHVALEWTPGQRAMLEAMAVQEGLDPAEVLAEAERVLQEIREA